MDSKVLYFKNRLYQALVLAIISLSGTFLNCQRQKDYFRIDDLYSSAALKIEREQFKTKLIKSTIQPNLSLPFTAETEKQWREALWAAELILYRTDSLFSAIRLALSSFATLPGSLQRAVLEAAYCLYPTDLAQPMQEIAHITSTPKLFAMALSYLLKNDATPKARQTYLALLQSRFPNWPEDPILFSLENQLRTPTAEQIKTRPELAELLKHPIAEGSLVIYCLQRLNRDFPGLTIIKKPDGKFLRTESGDLFQVAHLARSSANLPGFLTHGNTPEGIFSIQGIDTSSSVFIGPAPNLQLILPYEGSVKKYFHRADVSDTTWNKELYASLLPEAWKDYEPIYEAYYAGAAGRNEIIAHGTTIDPNFYCGMPYFPFTPSLGCLTTLEIWSERDGHCKYSGQIAFMNAIQSLKSTEGYLIVVEIDDKAQPVTLPEIINDILLAEAAIS